MRQKQSPPVAGSGPRPLGFTLRPDLGRPVEPGAALPGVSAAADGALVVQDLPRRRLDLARRVRRQNPDRVRRLDAAHRPAGGGVAEAPVRSGPPRPVIGARRSPGSKRESESAASPVRFPASPPGFHLPTELEPAGRTGSRAPARRMQRIRTRVAGSAPAPPSREGGSRSRLGPPAPVIGARPPPGSEEALRLGVVPRRRFRSAPGFAPWPVRGRPVEPGSDYSARRMRRMGTGSFRICPCTTSTSVGASVGSIRIASSTSRPRTTRPKVA